MSNEMGKSRIDEALRAVREASSGMEAPPALEAKLLEAFRNRDQKPITPTPVRVLPHRAPRWRWAVGSIAAALAVVTSVALLRESSGEREPSGIATTVEPGSRRVEAVPSRGAASRIEPSLKTSALADPSVRDAVRGIQVRNARQSPDSNRVRLSRPAESRVARRTLARLDDGDDEPEEVTTPYFAVPYAPRLSHDDAGQVVRVKLPRSSMRAFGLPVSGERMFDRVEADVLMGQDGVARAVRFVR